MIYFEYYGSRDILSWNLKVRSGQKIDHKDRSFWVIRKNSLRSVLIAYMQMVTSPCSKLIRISDGKWMNEIFDSKK